MKHTGTLIGLMIGWIVAGPIGAIVGIILGYYLEFEQLFPISQKEKHSIQDTFFDATFSVMGHIAKADGRVSEEEIKAASHVMDELGLNAEQKKRAIALFTEGKSSVFNLEYVMDRLVRCCGSYNDLMRMFLEIQFESAYADGQLSKEERRILKHICHRLGLTTIEFFTLDTHFRTLYSDDYQSTEATQSQEQLHMAYQLLGISPNATDKELKKTYRRLMNQHHPDKLMAKGLPKSLVKLATEKTQEIQVAYRLIREARERRV